MSDLNILDDLSRQVIIKRVSGVVKNGDLVHRGDGSLSPVSTGFVIGASASEVVYPVYRVYEVRECE